MTAIRLLGVQYCAFCVPALRLGWRGVPEDRGLYVTHGPNQEAALFLPWRNMLDDPDATFRQLIDWMRAIHRRIGDLV